MGVDEMVDQAIEVDKLLKHGCDAVEALLEATRQSQDTIKNIVEKQLADAIKKDNLSFGGIAAFSAELDAVVYNTCHFIEKLKEHVLILENTRTIYARTAAKNLKPDGPTG